MVGEIKVDVPEDLPLNDLRKKILDKYYGIFRLDRVVGIEEILDLEEDTWQYWSTIISLSITIFFLFPTDKSERARIAPAFKSHRVQKDLAVERILISGDIDEG